MQANDERAKQAIQAAHLRKPEERLLAAVEASGVCSPAEVLAAVRRVLSGWPDPTIWLGPRPDVGDLREPGTPEFERALARVRQMRFEKALSNPSLNASERAVVNHFFRHRVVAETKRRTLQALREGCRQVDDPVFHDNARKRADAAIRAERVGANVRLRNGRCGPEISGTISKLHAILLGFFPGRPHLTEREVLRLEGDPGSRRAAANWTLELSGLIADLVTTRLGWLIGAVSPKQVDAAIQRGLRSKHGDAAQENAAKVRRMEAERRAPKAPRQRRGASREVPPSEV